MEQEAPSVYGGVLGTGAKYDSRTFLAGELALVKSIFGYSRTAELSAYMSEPQPHEVAVVLTFCKTYWFTESAGTYTAKFSGKQTLRFNASICRFIFTDCNGDVWYFTPEGSFAEVVRANAQSVGVLQRDSEGRPLKFGQTYLVGGKPVQNQTKLKYNAKGLVEKITTARTKNPTADIRRNVYTYYEADEAYGNEDDLKTVTEQILSGTTWVDKDTTYYRYYQAEEAGGFEHGLKFVLGPDAFARLSEDPQVTDSFLASDAKVAEYADNYYEYNSEQRATKSVVQAGLLTYTFSYATSAHSDDYNHWKTKSTVLRPDGSQLITYSNYISQVLLTDLVDGTDHWTEYHQFDANARQTLHAQPSAVISYDDTQADLGVVLRTSAGLIGLTTYYATTTATSSTPGGAAGYVQYTQVQQGTSGAPITLSETTYYQRVAGEATIYPVAATTVYRFDDGTGGITTSYAYTWLGTTAQVQQRTTTLPVVPSGQNGIGTTDTLTEIFDEYGNLVWQRDARGFITYRAYDLALGVVTQEIQDVDSAKLALPGGWTTPVGGGLHLITDYEHDALGRTTQVLGPAHDALGQTVRSASWTVYKDLDDETYSGQGYATGTAGEYEYTLVNPVSLQQMAPDGLSSKSITAVRRCTSSEACACAVPEAGVVESVGRLSASDCFGQSSWIRWSESFSNKQGQLLSSRTYHTIPESGDGELGLNYDETTYGYDLMNRQNRSVSPTGTISRTVYDVRGMAISSWLGTNDSRATDSDPTGGGASGNNMVQLSASVYDGGTAGGDGNVTQTTAYVDGSTTRVTTFTYDFRNRRTIVDGEIDFYQQTSYDNLNQTIQVDRRNTSSGGNLIARSETKFDNRGRVYQTLQYAVNPSTGTVGNSLVSNTFYDASGHTIESQSAGSEAFSKSTYDGVGRQVTSRVGYYDDSEDEVIFQASQTAYDAASNVVFTTSQQRFHDATGTGPLNGPSGAEPKSRDSYLAMWQDGAGRSIASANYGTNDNVGPPERPSEPPTSSALVLVSRTAYNERGEAFESIDPAGLVSRTYADDAGRTVLTIQNYVAGEGCLCPAADQNVMTEMRYGLGGQLAQLIAKNQATGDQVTRYEYGVTFADSDVASNELLRAEVYPDSASATDRVTYGYNRQGQRTRMQDQNGSVHEYEYDALGRQTADKVITLAAGVDDAVRRLGTSYEVRGLVEQVTSYSDAAGTTPVNQVQNTYNSFAQLTHQYQEHGGAVNTGTTPKVQYAYDDGSENTVRPISMTYPDGRVLQYLYDDEAADKLSRIRTLRWDGTDVCQYSYLGLGTFVTTDYLEPEIKLDYAIGSGSDPYTGFDRFGRIVDLLWEKYGTSSSSSSSSSSGGGGPGNELVHLQ